MAILIFIVASVRRQCSNVAEGVTQYGVPTIKTVLNWFYRGLDVFVSEVI
jgi:hypothetical protein